MNARFVFYHKQPTSARMRFMVFKNGSVLSGPDLPSLSVSTEVERDYDSEDIVAFPLNGLGEVLECIGVPAPDARLVFPDFATIETPQGDIPVHGVQFMQIDPPFEQIEKAGARFIEMTQARQLSPMDMEMIRRIYVHAIGG